VTVANNVDCPFPVDLANGRAKFLLSSPIRDSSVVATNEMQYQVTTSDTHLVAGTP
jgi:hypothetical protein